MLFGASRNFDFIDITIFCHGIYYKSPFKFFNYLFFLLLKYQWLTSHDFMYSFRSAKLSNWLSMHYYLRIYYLSIYYLSIYYLNIYYLSIYYLSIYYLSWKAKHPYKLFIELKFEKSATKTAKNCMKITRCYVSMNLYSCYNGQSECLKWQI